MMEGTQLTNPTRPNLEELAKKKSLQKVASTLIEKLAHETFCNCMQYKNNNANTSMAQRNKIIKGLLNPHIQ
jgi:hypothetical protein